MPSPPPRNRSRSPRPTKKSSSNNNNSSGFRWKEKPRRDAEEPRESKRLERGYRDREDDHDRRRREREGRDGGGSGSRRHDGREEDRRRDREGNGERRRDGQRNSATTGDEVTKPTDAAPSRIKDATAAVAASPPQQQHQDTIDIASKFGPSFSSSSLTTNNPSTPSNSATTIATTSHPTTSTTRPPVSTGPMIVIKINDRLGTTTKVPCLASDSIGDLKKLVAMRIGRKPHEIMLKRQSERPFKDFLTLADYGVSDGVQLDLEIDTGG